MPKTKFQDFIFTIIMVIVMVYAMVCYNIAFDNGVGNDIFLLALHELPIMGVIGFLLEFFAVFIALIITVAAAVASIFIAVPTIVWSALKFIDATASRSE